MKFEVEVEIYDGRGPFKVVKCDDGYEVSLPHQCEEWAVTTKYEYDTGEVAILRLEEFLADGAAALEALRRHVRALS